MNANGEPGAPSQPRAPHESLRRCNILGVQVVVEPLADVVAAIEATLRRPGRHALCVCPTGVHGVIEAQKDPALRRFLNGAAFNVADGMPLVRAGQMMGFPQAERAAGPGLMWQILERARGSGLGHFFCGGREGVADALAARVAESFPGTRIAGTFCPPFRPLTPGEEEDIARRINESGADVVWVGLSTPGQLRWAAAMQRRLDVKLICTVGAAFDYHTGCLRRAPEWMQEASLEWLYRLAQEPRRLWRRYMEVVPRFLWLFGLQLLGLRRYDAD